MSEHWQQPEGGPHQVAIREDLYFRRQRDVDDFFGRPLWKRDHHVVYDGTCYVVFAFKEKSDADRFMTAFNGEPFDPHDMGSASNWTKWYKGRTAKRRANRNPYDFTSEE